MKQDEFDLMIGQLDRVLSQLVGHGRRVKQMGLPALDEANLQTLKHHAEDMMMAGEKILKDIETYI